MTGLSLFPSGRLSGTVPIWEGGEYFWWCWFWERGFLKGHKVGLFGITTIILRKSHVFSNREFHDEQRDMAVHELVENCVHVMEGV